MKCMVHLMLRGKKSSFLIALCILCAGALLSSYEETIGNPSLVEGAWEMKTAEYDKTVYADSNGQSHLKDSSYVRTYGDKENVWLFYQNSISEWSSFEYDGETLWEPYMCDCYRNYVIEGEGNEMQIIQTAGSIIPGMEEYQTVTRYKVEKLTRKELIISYTDTMYISDTQSTVDVQVVLCFQRENTLMDFIRNMYIID